jgi:hypothetical protein
MSRYFEKGAEFQKVIQKVRGLMITWILWKD